MAAKKNKWHRGKRFPSLQEGREALIQLAADRQEAFRVIKEDHKRFFIGCITGPSCPYRIELYVRRDTTMAQLNRYDPKHTCYQRTDGGGMRLGSGEKEPAINAAQSETAIRIKSDENDVEVSIPEENQVVDKPSSSLPGPEEDHAVDRASSLQPVSDPKPRRKSRKSPSPRHTPYDKGLRTRREVLGNQHVDRALASNSSAFSRPMQEIVTEFAWGNVWNREGLSRQQRSLLNIGLLTALNRTPELAMHIRGAVNNGLSEVEIREAIIHSMVYCGAPAGMEATRTADRVLGEMQQNGEHERVLK